MSSLDRNEPTMTSTLMPWKKPAATLVLALAAMTLSAGAQAHGATKPAHGGIVQMSGETLFELVAEPAGTAIYIVDEDDEVPSSGLTAKLVIFAKGAKSEVAMTPAAGNKFEAKGTKIPAGAKVSVQITNKATQVKTSAEFNTTK